MLIRALLLLCCLSVPALAQTTTFGQPGFPCESEITVSGGGLTLTASPSTVFNRFCQANIGKFQYSNTGTGLWYYTFTPSSTINQQVYGFSSVPTITGAYPAAGQHLGGSTSPTGIGFVTNGAGGAIYYATHPLNGVATPAATGKTGAVVVNLNTDSPQMWATGDISNLVCDGTGAGGFTHPQWNGSCASDPSIPGTGSSGTTFGTVGGTGANVFIPSYYFYPAVTLAANDATTVSFADNATLDTYLPAGYHAWNTNNGTTCAFPCTTDTVTVNIANAPGYQTNHAYAAGSRVLAGPGWNSGTQSFVNGQPLYLWALQGAGGTSGSSQPAGFASCPIPANYGGGFTGGTRPAQWLGKTALLDNGLTWVCLTPVDYPNVSSAMYDTPLTWATNPTGTCTTRGPGCYWYFDFVVNNGAIFRQAGTGVGGICATSPSGPGPTGGGGNDNQCLWYPIVNFVYSPGTFKWPLNVSPPPISPGLEQAYTYNVTINIWYGGVARPLYQAGQNNEESSEINLGWRNAFVHSVSNPCKGGVGAYGQSTPQCLGEWDFLLEDFTAAPGDSFRDNLTPGTGPLRADQTKGVMFYSNVGPCCGDAQLPLYGTAATVQDTSVEISNLQFVTTQGNGLAVNPGDTVYNNIIEYGGFMGIFGCCTSNFTNNLIIQTGTIPGSMGIWTKYPSMYTYNTIVCNPAVANTTAIVQDRWDIGPMTAGGGYPGPPIADNLMLGCANPFGYEDTQPTSFARNANNATDIPNGYSGNVYVNAFTAYNSHTSTTNGIPLPGTTYGLTASSELINPAIGGAFDGRIKSTSSQVYGAGGTYTYGIPGNFYNSMIPPPPDIFGAARPSSGRYDIGVAQFFPSGPIAVGGGGRSWFH